MKIISKVRIEGFRSIRSAEVGDLGDFTALAGLNNSGKSNLLRALNAFFTGFTDPGTPVDLASDYYRPDLSLKKARRVRVTVSFTLPSSFNFRKDLKAVEDLLGGTEFSIAKEWSRSQPQPAYYLNGQLLDLNDQRKVEQFLQLVTFRYIPNRVLPVEVIKGEHRALRDALIRRVAKRAPQSSDAFKALRETSASMIKGLVERFRALHPDAESLRLATPASWGEMVFAFGYLLQQQGSELEDFLQGSGIQSILMLETLLLIDQDYFQKFGWRQAAVWGLEEPESSLHTSLEVQIASYLSLISSAARSRLQVFSTTHSDLMLQYADKAFFVERGGAGSVFQLAEDSREALELSASSGVTRWTHPILYHPLDPLILVEGKHDRVFLERSLEIMRPGKRVEVADLEKLAEPGSGGVERLLSYVRENARAIRARSPKAKVVVLLDWDASGKQNAFRRLFDVGDPFAVFAWPSSAFNPLLGRSFHGIERHYPDRLIERAEAEGVTIARTSNGVCMIEADQFRRLKRIMFDIVDEEGLEPDDLTHVKAFLEQVLKSCGV